MKAIRIILASLKRADKTYKLINDNDRVMVGISGGKDSMALFYALNLYQKYIAKNFVIVPMIIDLGFPNFNSDKIAKYIKKFDYDLIVINAKNVYSILKANQKENKHLPCSICSRMKKAIINKAAKQYKCQKVAFAHHIDDAVETLFLNIFYSGKIATFEPKMHLSKMNIDFIRPLVLAKESDIKRLIIEEDIPVIKSHCPADKMTTREEIKKALNKIYQKDNLIQKNVYTSLINEKQIKLWYKKD